MKSEQDCSYIQENLWRYIDRELSAPDLADLSAHLKVCRRCSKLYDAQAREAKLYRLAFVESPFGEAFVEKFRRKYDLERQDLGSTTASGWDPATPLLRGLPGGLARILPKAALASPRKYLGRAALLLALISISASIFFGLQRGPVLGRCEFTPGVELVRGKRTLDEMNGSRGDLRPGDSFRLDEESELRLFLNDGSELILEGPGDFRVQKNSRPDGEFDGWLGEGTLTAYVSKRKSGNDLKIETPHAFIRVVGTQYTLQVDSDGTSLDVMEGRVLFRGKGEPQSQLVEHKSGSFRVTRKKGLALPLSGMAAPEKTSPAPAPAPDGPERNDPEEPRGSSPGSKLTEPPLVPADTPSPEANDLPTDTIPPADPQTQPE